MIFYSFSSREKNREETLTLIPSPAKREGKL